MTPNGDNGLQSTDRGAAACTAAVQQSSSVGCEYYAVHMDGLYAADNGCLVTFLANTSDSSVHPSVSFLGAPVDMSGHMAIPRGRGRDVTYDPIGSEGLPPGEVAILFLAGPPEAGTPTGNVSAPVPCPVAPALSSLTQLHGTGRSAAFRIKTDAPVVAYQMLPYGGGNAAVTGATLLLPTSAYGTNYIAFDAYGAGDGTSGGGVNNNRTSMDIVASADGTEVTITPKFAIVPGGTLPGAPANAPVTYAMKAGEVIQLTQPQELTGSAILANKPIAIFGGHPCTNVPAATPFCDHAEQQIPPVQALGSEYMAVTYRPRTDKPENPPYRIVGAVDGTALQWSKNVGGPSSLSKGQLVEFQTGEPFVVRSQDKDHPFLLVGSMSSATNVGGMGYGDADIVRVVPVGQWLDRYVFFTDPTYPETNLVVTRTKGASGFEDVALDCAGVLGDWRPIDETHEYTRVDLVRHDFVPQNGCNNGRHEMTSKAPFGLTVWGWGTPETVPTTGYVSYGYPAGENVKKLTDVIVPP